MSIILGNIEIESFSDQRIIADILANLKVSDYREKQGEIGRAHV